MDGFFSKSWPGQLRRGAAAAARGGHGGGGGLERREAAKNPPPMLNTLSSVSVRESRIQYLCDPQWFRDTASRGPTTIVAPESQFRTCPSDHDNIGYPRMSASGESSTTMHRLLHASGSHPIPPPNDPKTNQYNQDLGLIHSTNGNHLESPNEGSSIDHQVTIHLHDQNITMFPTNETWAGGRGRVRLISKRIETAPAVRHAHPRTHGPNSPTLTHIIGALCAATL
ncbi:hypothetical protein F511_15450 [Dorcoceras hygrometricum]|uniref:Uncharacterized protein n=1 Tax=Dorcoceras hygrometricum TaxID=472368 RepID=A0A2Z7CR84_9LAMI|nr:hypothetical protein F511_15450 [Dorcoceras hygrometricum]